MVDPPQLPAQFLTSCRPPTSSSLRAYRMKETAAAGVGLHSPPTTPTLRRQSTATTQR